MHLKGTRQAITEALTFGLRQQGGIVQQMLYGCKIDKSPTDRSHSIVDGLEAGYILAAVDLQKPHIAAWLRHNYGYIYSRELVSDLAKRLRIDLFSDIATRQHPRMFGLCTVAVDDYKYRLQTGQMDKGIPRDVYSHAMGTSESHFQRDFGRKRGDIFARIQDWDSEGIANISIMLRALRGEGSFRPSQLIAEWTCATARIV